MRQHSFLVAAGLALLASAPAFATTRSSFLTVDSITGITVTPMGGLSYEVALAQGATFVAGGNSFAITDLIGFYALSDVQDFSPLAALSSVGAFSDDSTNAGQGGVAGWRSNPNQGLTPGQSLVFTFDGLDQAHNDRWGFHVRVPGLFPGTTGNTGSITTVPTPAAGLVFGLGSCVALRRRR